jgi:hypothetical protein
MIDLFRLAPADLERFIYLQSLVDRQTNEAVRIQALREYYAGEHPVLLTERQREFLGPIVAKDAFTFAHNLARSVVDTLSERLSVQGFAVNGASMGDDAEAGPDAALSAELWRWWKANRLDLSEQEVYAHAFVDGRAFVMVDYDAGAQRPRMVAHRVDDGKSGIVLHRDSDDPSRILYATRYWFTFDPLRRGETGIARRTVYLPHEIRKYRAASSMAGGWVQVQDEGDASWPLPWVDRLGAPLGVPVIEFANPGGSEIAPIVGLQNALNKTWLDVIASADQSGFPMMVAEYPAGQGVPLAASDDDLTGADELRLSPGRILEIDGGTIKRLEAANLAPMLGVKDALVEAVAGISRTPQYYLRPVGGDVPSGEALKQLESGLVARAVKRQRIFGQGWEDVFQLAMRVADAFGPFSAADAPSLEVQWADAETRNEQTQATIAEAHKRLGVPDAQNWLTLGFTPEQIAGFEAAAAQKQAEQVAGIAAALRVTQNGGGTNNGRTSNPVQGQQGGNGL